MIHPLVTIAIASYNNAPYIERCIDSVIQQSYRNLEILIVDDGSKDNTSYRIEKYKSDERVRIIYKENGGLSSVRQRGLDEAQGNFICFIDADDYLSNTYIEKLLKKIEEDKSDICVSSTRFEDASGIELIEESRNFLCTETRSPFQILSDQFNDITISSIDNIHLSDSWNKMYRMSFLKETNVSFSMPKGLNGTDSLFNQLLFLHSPLYSSISSEEYIHVIYKKSAVHRKKKDLLTSFQIITQKLIDESRKRQLLEFHKSYISKQYHIYVYTSYKDVYTEITKMNERLHAFRLLESRHHSFMSSNYDIIEKEVSGCGTAVQLFSFLIRHRMNIMLLLYFKLINITANLYNKAF